MKIFFDGGCRPNPGMMEIAIVAGGRTLVQRDLGHGTRADAEWLALIEALRVARSLMLDDILLLGDAADIIDQASGKTRCRGAGLAHLHAFRALVPDAGRLRIRHVKRTQNLAGIALARLHPR